VEIDLGEWEVETGEDAVPREHFVTPMCGVSLALPSGRERPEMQTPAIQVHVREPNSLPFVPRDAAILGVGKPSASVVSRLWFNYVTVCNIHTDSPTIRARDGRVHAAFGAELCCFGLRTCAILSAYIATTCGRFDDDALTTVK
jgi:hypothetical protein